VKAAKRGDLWLADRVYSGVPAEMVGRTQLIEIGPMSGVANVSYWLSSRGYDPAPELVDRIFAAAKQAKAVLEDKEIERIVVEFGVKPVS